MPWNGSGSFSRTDGTRNGTTVWAQAKAAAVKILSADHDTHDQDLATGINNCLTKDGQNSPTANLAMNTKKLTGLAAGSSAGDSVRYEQFQGEGLEYDSGVLRVKLADATLTRSASGLKVTTPVVSEFTTGDMKATLKAVADAGWVLMDDGTIGDTTSSATTRADDDTEDLFTLLWTNCADAQCAVSGGRGASAAADFAAHKTIALPKILGRAIGAAGAGNGLTSRELAETTGAETATLTEDNIPELASDAINYRTGTLASPTDNNTFLMNDTRNATGTTAIDVNVGSTPDAFSIMPPVSFLNFMIKL